VWPLFSVEDCKN